jgi:hypothetical protein
MFNNMALAQNPNLAYHLTGITNKPLEAGT